MLRSDLEEKNAAVAAAPVAAEAAAMMAMVAFDILNPTGNLNGRVDENLLGVWLGPSRTLYT